ncbi:MAG: pyruvate formate lyase family protein [Armatimonadota bacterium]|jgi:formate C-acetyltransferase
MAIAVRTEGGPGALSDWSRDLREIVAEDAAAFTEGLVWFAESFAENESEPFREIRVARAVAHVFENMPVRIREGERLVGWHPSTHPDDETAARIQEARQYLSRENWRTFVSEGHMAPDYPTVLHCGLDGVMQRIRGGVTALDPVSPTTPEKRAFYEACRIALEGLQGLIRRYAALAGEEAETAQDPDWRAELEQIARACQRIASEPPRTFREAIQLAWFMFLGVAIEAGAGHHCFGPGRMDQYLLRHYKAERESGALDEDLVDDLLAQLFIKSNEFDGPQMSAVITVVGGRKPDGSDATNELSYRMLEISDRVRMYFLGVDVSWHEDMDAEFVRRAVALLRNGKGQPSFFNSDVIVKGLVRHGVPFEHAVDHLPSTCTETSIMGRSNPCVAWPYVNVPMCLLYALFGGVHPLTGAAHNFAQDVGLRPDHLPHSWRDATQKLVAGPPQTYAELRSAFVAVLKHAADGAVAHCQADMYLESLHRPFPLLSCLMEGCLERGLNISSGGALYNFIQPEAVGVSNTVDGLAAVKTLAEDEGRYSLDDFRAAIEADFTGFDELLRAIQRECPKHGNDIEWVNDLFAEVAGAWCGLIEGHTNFLGGPMFPGFLGWIVWIRYGENTPATPDGRRAGEPLANSIMNCTTVQPKGLPALVLSTSGLDQSRALGGVTFNVRFQASALQEEKGIDALKGLIEAAFDLGAYQMQVNLTSTETMRAAQEKPDEYRDLLVRIGGYLVPFTLLPRNAQEEVIARTELEM